MSIRFYLLPVEILVQVHPVTLVETSSRVPKYRSLWAGANWQGMDFGFEPVYLLAADVDTTQHANIAANADVSAMPVSLDATLGAQRQVVEDALESRNLPGNWVTTGMTYRTVLRVVVGAMLLAQRFSTVDGGELFPSGVTLNTPYSDLPVDFRDHLRQSMDALGYDRSMLGGSSTMRDMFKEIGQQATPVTFLGVTV